MFRPKTNETIPKFGSTFSQTFRRTLLQRILSAGIASAWIKPYVESSQARCCSYVIFSQARSPCTSFQCETHREATKAGGLYYFVKLTLTRFLENSPDSRKNLRRNPSHVGVTSGQKPCTKIIYIVLQTSVGLF